jgi:hypothetical protein
MLNSSILKKVSLFFIGAVFFISCDKDFDGIGSNIVGDDHSDFQREISSVIATSIKTGAVETGKLPINPLGILDNGKFGKTTANFVTQLELASENPTFKNVTEERIESVVLKIPYFSHVKETTSDATTYELDSIYGNETAKMVLNVYENGYYMRDFDPATNFQVQKYYSDQDDIFNGAKRGTDGSGNSVAGGTRLNDTLGDVAQNTQFIFSPAQITIPATTEGGEATKEAPQMRLLLNKKFFFKKIFDNQGTNLANNNVFKTHFKGLYFQVEELSGGALAMLDFSKATITIGYKEDKVTTVYGVSTVDGYVRKTLVLNLRGNSASLLKHTPTANSGDYDSATGTEKLYLKGGQGSVALIDLFGGGDSPELDALRVNAISNNWLINEANLVFNVEQNDMENTYDPNRIYLYDATNYRPIVDYYVDQTSNTSKPKYAKLYYNGIAQLTGASGDTDRKATRYKIRVTEHIKNLIYKDSTNIKLGLAVTENIANVANLSLKTALPQAKKIPLTSVISPLGTIISGSTDATPIDKRLKLEIIFTKPN